MILSWLFDPAHWAGPTGVFARLAEHLVYSGAALLVAAVIALPVGIWVGVTGRGVVLVAGLANVFRALPTLGLLILAVLVLSPSIHSDLAYVIPSLVVLVLLAIPPILTNTYAGIQAVDRGAVDAAAAMGYTRRQLLTHVQLPCALPLMLSGLRNALLQVVSTATVAAYVSLGGLGRLILDGRAQRDYSEMASGALLMAVLALVLELALILLERLTTSPGLTRRTPRRAGRPGRGAVALPPGSSRDAVPAPVPH